MFHEDRLTSFLQNITWWPWTGKKSYVNIYDTATNEIATPTTSADSFRHITAHISCLLIKSTLFLTLFNILGLSKDCSNYTLQISEKAF